MAFVCLFLLKQMIFGFKVKACCERAISSASKSCGGSQMYQVRTHTVYRAAFRWLDMGFKGTGSRFSACSLIKMLFFCRDMLYRPCKQYDHVIMWSKNQSAHSPGRSHLHLVNLNICK